MNKKLLAMIGIGCLGVCSAANAGDITYDVDRTIGAGTVVGTITTDGVLGVVSSSDIVAWTFTLTDPSLYGGSPDTILSSASAQTTVSGSDLVATASSLTWNFAPADGAYWDFQGSDLNYWCGANADSITCLYESDPAETMGFLVSGDEEVVSQSGIVTIASVPGSTAVPEPTTLGLLVLGLAGLGLPRRKRKA